jgi:hypothetical protein|tara:strand:- start:355 stop:654 length:300 start_codon:yes stop_codon:yes gene_type:complete
MSTTTKIAQVVGGAGGNGFLVDTISSVTLSDTRIRMYTYAVTAASEIVIGDSKGPVIKQPVLTTNTGDSIYMQDDGIRCKGNVSVAGASDAGKIYVYYG